MFKIGEAADRLGVEKVVIFEKLINHKLKLDPYVLKRNSITYISEEGIAVLEGMIYNKSLPQIEEEQSAVREIIEEEAAVSESEISEDITVAKQEDAVTSEDEFDRIQEIKMLVMKKSRIKKQIQVHRKEMIQLDSEIRRLDEAIINYQKILKDDIEWISMLEDKLEHKLKERLESVELRSADEEDQNQKNLINRLFNRT